MKTNTRKMRKAQSATEYLMTYGWAILAIAIVGALLYTQVFQTKKCAEGAIGFPITGALSPDGIEYSVNTTGYLTILLKNTVGKKIKITSIQNVDTTTATGTLVNQVNISDGKTGTVSISGFKTGMESGDCYSTKTNIKYETYQSDGNTLNGVDLIAGGTLNGKAL